MLTTFGVGWETCPAPILKNGGTTMTLSPVDLIEGGIDYDIEDILASGLPDRRILLAALTVAEHIAPVNRRYGGWVYDVAVEWNAQPDGWEFGIHAMGSIHPGYEGVHFTPQELHTVVRLARYLVAREYAPPDAAKERAS